MNMIRSRLAAGLCLVLSVACFFSGASAQPGRMQIIVLDPGHGGYDTGRRGFDGSYEKDMTLVLTRLIAKRLERHFRVVLTRTGDYFLENADRVAKANLVQADLFLSIHAADAGSRDQQILTVGYYGKVPPVIDGPSSEMPLISGRETAPVFVDWHTVHHNHYTGSKAAAAIFKDTLSDIFSQRGRLVEARLIVLAGADMPAVMIEIGGLEMLTTSFFQADGSEAVRLADAIGKALKRIAADLN